MKKEEFLKSVMSVLSGKLKVERKVGWVKPNPKIAFTLAEVLITLGVIGVVASLTMPALVQHYKEKQTVVQLKKIYSILSQAYSTTIANGETPDQYTYQFTQNDEPYGSYDVSKMIKYLKVAKDCGFEAKGCFKNRYKQTGSALERDFENMDRYYKAILADGTIIAFGGSGTSDEMKYYGEIWVDVNGEKQPNQVGKDLFFFRVLKNGIIIPGFIEINEMEEKDPDIRKINCLRGKDYYDLGCTSWVIYNGNMDYLHCDDLRWNSKTKCK